MHLADFKDADVNDILRLISEVSGLNSVAGPEVKGTVTIKLADVPWDLALEIILKTNQPQLAQIRESENIIRITTAEKILDEEHKRRQLEEARQKSIQAQQAAEPKFTRYFPIASALEIGTAVLVSAAIVAVVLAATWVPTRRAIAIEPRDALWRE